MNAGKRVVLGLAILALAGPLAADDLSNASAFLCSPMHATVCKPDGSCETRPPWTLNIPLFIQVDLDEMTLSTTEASGQNRSTAIKNKERHEGDLILQGAERGRAFNIVIHQETGLASFAVTAQDLNIAIFGACTPIPERRPRR